MMLQPIRSKDMFKHFKLVSVTIFFLLITFIYSCASVKKLQTPARPVHAYDGTQPPISELARITGETIPGDSYVSEQQVRILKVDGVEYDDDHGEPPREIYLKPGNYQLIVRYSCPDSERMGGWLVKWSTSRYDEELSLNIKEGENYILHLEPMHKGIRLTDVKFWITDSSGQTVCKSD